MKVGILGSGDVARALAAGFLKNGHDVVLGTGSPPKLAEWRKQHSAAQITDFPGAADAGELLVLAVKGSAAEDVLRIAGDERIRGKTVIDATNPIDDAPPEEGVLRFFTGPNESLLERLQVSFPEARFVKAFNSVGHALMVDPDLPGGPPTMFVCGAFADAKTEVCGILEQFGWAWEDMGGAAAARAIEPLCMLWCIPGFRDGDWTHAFRLLR